LLTGIVQPDKNNARINYVVIHLPLLRHMSHRNNFMSKLTAKKRKNLKKSSFAIPSKRSYPIEDKTHAKNALARVSQFGTSTQKTKVRAAILRKYPNIGKD